MRKLFAFCLLALCIAANAQQKINFLEGTFAQALKQAKSANKPLFYMGYATWCPHCNKMKKEVFTDSTVTNFFNKHFVCAWQDMEAGEGPAMRKEFHIHSYPAFLFFSPNGELLYSVSAEFTAADLIKEAQNAIDPKKQLPTLKADFEKDVTNADNCLKYVSALRRSNLDTEEAADKYLSTQTEPQLISAANWRIIANGVRDVNSREFRYVLKNQKEFAAVSSPKRVEKKIVNMVQEWLDPSLGASDTVAYLKKRADVRAIGMAKVDSLIFTYDLHIFETAKGWKTYRKITAESVPKLSWNNAAQLKDIALVYMNNIDDKKATDDAIAWAERSQELKESYDTMIIIGRLYLKNDDMKKAREWGEKAKAMAESYKWNTTKADEILGQIK